MGKLDDQIHELKKRQTKIDLYLQVANFVQGLEPGEEHGDIYQEIQDEFGGFIESAIGKIEQGEKPNPTPNQISKEMLDRQAEKEEPPQPQQEDPPQQQPEQKSTQEKQDTNKNLLDFVKKYGRFGFKKVTATTLDGDTVTGTVKQVQYPNVLVESEHGGLVEVQPESMQLLEE